MLETKFKQTEIGLIPQDWEDLAIRELGMFVKGTINPQTMPKMLFQEYSMPAFDVSKLPNIVEGLTMNSSRTPISGDVLLINKLNVRQKRIWHVNNAPDNAVCSGEFLPFISNHVCLDYLKYLLLSDKVVNEWNENSTGTSNSQKRVSPDYVLNYRLPIPKIDEQRKIAEFLNKIEKLISTLNNLIEKKKNIKIATMQQLLTGKKRLAGFSMPMIEKAISDVITIYKGQSLQSKNFVHGNIPVVAGGQSYAGFHNEANHRKTSVTISASGAYAGYVWLHEYPIFASDCSVIEGNDDVDIYYIYNVLKLKQNEIYKAQTGGAQPHVHSKDIGAIRIFLPYDNGKPNMVEQKAIAKIFTDMDKELLALEQKRSKFELIKHGMMQELLTGKIRLV